MTTPDTEIPPSFGQPEERTWRIEPEPAPEPATHRSEPANDDSDRGRPVGQIAAAGGSGAILGGLGLFQMFGPIGLAAGAVTAAGGAAAYGYYRVRGNRPGSRMSRPRPAARSTSRLGSVGKGGPKLSKGKGPNLLGGKGAKLGKGGGPKLGRGAKLGGGKASKFGGGSGRLLGGKGAKLGGKPGLSLGKGGSRTASRLGSVGAGRGKSLLGRGGKAGLGLGKRGKGGVTRWSKSTGAGAGTLGTKLGSRTGRAARKASAAALRTKTGQRAGKGFAAAKTALHEGGSGRLRKSTRAARAAMGSSRNPFARWWASVAAGIVALTAMGHEKWRKRHPEPESTEKAAPDSDNPIDQSEGITHPPDKPRPADERTIDDFTAEELWLTPRGRLALKESRIDDAKAAFKKLKDAGLVDPAAEAEHTKNIQRLEAEAAALRRSLGLPPRTVGTPAETPDSDVINPTRIHPRSAMTGTFPLAAISAEMSAAAAQHEPQGMMQVANELDQLGEVPANVALGIRGYMTRLESGYPIHPAVVEKTQELAIAMAHLKSLADEIGPLFKICHAKDLQRFDAPRTNEAEWDVTRNG